MSTTLEKTIAATTIVIILSFISLGVIVVKCVNDAGGISAVIVETGKEIKDISAEISAHETSK